MADIVNIYKRYFVFYSKLYRFPNELFEEAIFSLFFFQFYFRSSLSYWNIAFEKNSFILLPLYIGNNGRLINCYVFKFKFKLKELPT